MSILLPLVRKTNYLNNFEFNKLNLKRYEIDGIS